VRTAALEARRAAIIRPAITRHQPRAPDSVSPVTRSESIFELAAALAALR
jgi:hypothetical protein